MFELKDSDYQLTGSTSGTPLATQNTPDGLPPSSLPAQQTNNHLQGLPAYSHNDYSNYPTLPVSNARHGSSFLTKFINFLDFICEKINVQRNVDSRSFLLVLLSINHMTIFMAYNDVVCCTHNFISKLYCRI